MSLTNRVLLALILGLAAGYLVARSGVPWLAGAASAIEPVGTLFINAIRMTVVPLVVASLIVGVGSAPDARSVGAVGGRAVALFLAILFVGAGFAAVVGPPLLARLPVDPEAAASLRAAAASAGETTTKLPTFGQWLVDLVPSNPVKAAADGSMLPLIIFSVAFGLALTRVDAASRSAVLGFFQSVAEAMLTLVRWILAFAPLGVFALSVPLAAKLGLTAAGALAYYVVATAVMILAFTALVLYPIGVVMGRLSLRAFAQACAPAQAVAFSARSSLASLPAMIEQARDRLHLSPVITSFLLPLAASTFRAGGAVGITMGVLFIARLYDIPLTVAQLATVVVTVVMVTFSVPGVPAGSVLVMLPALLAAGLPPAGIGILIGIDTIPDMVRTVSNVTADMATAAALDRHAPAVAPTPSGDEDPLRAPAI